jgi:hypothetical protein
MQRLAAVSLIALGAGLIAACHKPAGGGSAANLAAPAGGPASAPSADVVIDASQAPHPRAGAWEMTTNMGGMGGPIRFCVGDKPFDVGKIKAHCQSFVFRRTLTGVAIDATCGEHGISSTMHMTAQGDFNSAYATDIQTTIALRPGMPPQVIKAHTDYRYVGACTPAEQAEADSLAKGGHGG